jgi:hypothetical protein
VRDYVKAPFGLTVQVWPGRDYGKEPFDSFSAKKVRIAPLYERSKGASIWDYALITLDKTIGQQTFDSIKPGKLAYWGASGFGGRFSMSHSDATTIAGTDAFTAGYPGDKGMGQELFLSKGTLSNVGD